MATAPHDDLFAVLLDDAPASPASSSFDLVAMYSPSTSHNHCGHVLAMKVAGLFVYPIKGCGAIEVQSLRLDSAGIEHDRRFMLVDDEDAFLSQRNCPALSRYVPRLVGRDVEVSAPDSGDSVRLQVPVAGEVLDYQVWSRTESGVEIPLGSEWFSEHLGKSVRLLYAPLEAGLAYQDAAQVLVTSEASLEDLNGRMTVPVAMSRFRPNIVLEGVEAYAEDLWDRINAGECVLSAQERCGRCLVTTIDQETGKKTGTDPLRTLVKYRLFGSDACFGMYYSVKKAGQIQVGTVFST